MSEKPTAIITGAAGGMGIGLVAGFRAAGYDVIAVDRTAAAGITALDVRDEAAVSSLAASLDRLAVLINAAGIIRRREEYDPAVFAEVMAVNVTGMMRLCVACRPALARAGGAIVNIASLYALTGAPHAPAYSASKGAVVNLSKSLAIEWAKDGIRVNTIAPGWIATPMTEPLRADPARNKAILDRVPMGRWGTPDDILGPALFLASDAARFVTGAVLSVDGGYAAV
jgi:NAD(P)-dependent dehydrogenase (short-subunit alcohol dehydrogenase family)